MKGLGDYTIPPSNKFAADNDPKTLGEIYAYGSGTRTGCHGTSPTERCSRTTSG